MYTVYRSFVNRFWTGFYGGTHYPKGKNRYEPQMIGMPPWDFVEFTFLWREHPRARAQCNTYGKLSDQLTKGIYYREAYTRFQGEYNRVSRALSSNISAPKIRNRDNQKQLT